MPFLKPLVQDHGCTASGDNLVSPLGAVVAKCDHALGRWVLTPAGERLLGNTPAPVESTAAEAAPAADVPVTKSRKATK